MLWLRVLNLAFSISAYLEVQKQTYQHQKRLPEVGVHHVNSGSQDERSSLDSFEVRLRVHLCQDTTSVANRYCW